MRARTVTQIDNGVRARRGRRRGFTLLEALVASVALATVVLAVGSAVNAGHQQSFEGQKVILAAMASDDLMSEVASQEYDDLPTFDGLTQNIGEVATLEGAAYPRVYLPLGRSVLVEDQTVVEPALGLIVRGRRVVVTTFDAHRTLSTIETFIAEPSS